MRYLFTLALLAVSVATRSQTAPETTAVPFHGQGKFADSPDGKVYYETEGSGPPVFVVAAGPGGSHASFHPWFSRLAKDHTVVYFDNVGRGRSDRLKDPKHYTVPRDAEDIEAVRKALGYDRISVIGHSYGGMPALAYALKYPDHTSHIVLSDTIYSANTFQANIDSCNFNVRNHYPETWAKLMEMRRRGVKSCTEEYESEYGNAMMDPYWYNPAMEDRLFRSRDPGDAYNYEVYLAMIGEDAEWKVGGTLKGYDPSRRMRTMTTPTLICVGRYDRVSLPRVASEMNALIPSSKLVIFEQSGHRPWVEETERYFEMVKTFLDEANPPRH
jgi:proline iminopeptidase